MNKTRTLTGILALILLSLSVCSGFAQEEIPYVDVEEARAEIEALEDENAELREELERTGRRREELEKEITSLREKLDKTRDILGEVTEKGADLSEIFSDIVDPETRERARRTIEKNRRLKNILQETAQGCEAELNGARENLEAVTELITENQARLDRNEVRIRDLTASIEKTVTQTEVLNSYIETVEEINTEAEEYLSGTDY